MRKIEQEIYTAIRHNRPIHKGNTSVVPLAKTNGLYVWLHGNKIAELRNGTLCLSDCGWATATTRSRMNAVLDGLDLPFHVSIRGGKMQLEGRGKPIPFYQVSINMTNMEVTV